MNTSKSFWALISLFWALWASGVSAQTISQPVANTSVGNIGVGQSFTATVNGTVTAIEVASRAGGTYSLYLYNGAFGSGVGSVGSPIFPAQTVTLPLAAGFNDPLTRIELTTPLPVVAGSSYSFIIDGAWLGHLLNADGYAAGQLIFNYSLNAGALGDLRFAVHQLAAGVPVVSPSPIPSTSGWSLICASLLVLAATLFHRRRSGTRQRR